MSTFSAGSPGPLLSIIPSGFILRMSSAFVSHGTVTTSTPRFKSSLRIFAFAPKSHRTTFLPLPFFIASFWSFTFNPSFVTGTARYFALVSKTASALSSILEALPVTDFTAFFIVYALISFKSFSFSFGFSSAENALCASSELPEIIIPFITPASRRIFVSLRVSIPESPIMLFEIRKELRSVSQRKFDGVSHKSRTM